MILRSLFFLLYSYSGDFRTFSLHLKMLREGNLYTCVGD